MANSSGSTTTHGQSSPQRLLSAGEYCIYALDCSPDWELPVYYEPEMKHPRFTGHTYPLSALPVSILRPRNYQQAVVGDATDPDQPMIEIWRYLATEAETVYYVGQSGDFYQRLQTHQTGQGSKLTQEATITGVGHYERHQQDLSHRLLGALTEDIDAQQRSVEVLESLSGHCEVTYTDAGVPERVAELQTARNRIQAQSSSISLSDLAEIATDLGTDAVTTLLSDARAERRDREQEVALELQSADTHESEELLGERVNIRDIDVFTYWS